MLIAPLKPNGLPRPVQAIVTSYVVEKLFKSKEALNFLETGAGRTDPRYSQRGLSKDGCAYVVKKTQRLLEDNNALDLPHITTEKASAQLLAHGLISPDTVVDLKCDITEFFPSGNRKLILDVMEGSPANTLPRIFGKATQWPCTHVFASSFL